MPQGIHWKERWTVVDSIPQRSTQPARRASHTPSAFPVDGRNLWSIQHVTKPIQALWRSNLRHVWLIGRPAHFGITLFCLGR